MKYSYYPGCTLKNKAKDLDAYARVSARALGFELEEIDTEIADTIAQALQIEAAAERLLKTLPKFDCGNCGAPTCRAFSRDVAEGFADEGDCIFNIIKAMREGRSYEDESDEFVPPPFRRTID